MKTDAFIAGPNQSGVGRQPKNPINWQTVEAAHPMRPRNHGHAGTSKVTEGIAQDILKYTNLATTERADLPLTDKDHGAATCPSTDKQSQKPGWKCDKSQEPATGLKILEY